MTLTLLLDLDDTLLVNPLAQFIPAYLHLFASFVSDLVNPKQFGHQLLSSTDRMVANNKITQTLKNTFDDDFFPIFSGKRSQLESRIEDFYQEQYPTLKKFTQPRKEAVRLVESAFTHGMNVVIATNPIFPMQAQLQRLEWANLSLSQYPFKLVTAYEGLHFAKPNAAYYAEILAQLGWPDEPVCMVGDTYSDDILPAHELGIPTFLIKNSERSITDVSSVTLCGSLGQVEDWLISTSEKVTFSNKASILAGLQASPAAIESLFFKEAKSLLAKQENYFKNILQKWIKLENDFGAIFEGLPFFNQLLPITCPSEGLSTEEAFAMLIQHRAVIIDSLRNIDFSTIKHITDLLPQMIQNDQFISRQLIRPSRQ